MSRFQSVENQLLLSYKDALTPTLFHNLWWLEAATGGTCQEVQIQSDGVVVARLPYVMKRNWLGQRMCSMPELTHLLGPAIDLGSSRGPTRNLRHVQLTRELLAKLGRFDAFHQKLHPGILDTFAFTEAGCRTEVQFTFEIPPQPHDLTWRGMRDKTRNVIRRASDRYDVTTCLDAPGFAGFYEANLRSRNLVNTMSRMVPVCAAALAHDRGRIFAALDGGGSLAAAIFMVWDQRVAYYLLATRSLQADNGAISLLIWHGIRDAHDRGLTFDFDGVGTMGSRLLYTGFGGTIRPNLVVSKYSDRYRLALLVGKSRTRLARSMSARRH